MRYRIKKQIKAKKKDILEYTAINIGYHNSVLNHLPVYALIPVIKEFAHLINNTSKDKDIENILITESVRKMNYQDFKQIEEYFFN